VSGAAFHDLSFISEFRTNHDKINRHTEKKGDLYNPIIKVVGIQTGRKVDTTGRGKTWRTGHMPTNQQANLQHATYIYLDGIHDISAHWEHADCVYKKVCLEAKAS
jgi:hypothetical protein